MKISKRSKLGVALAVLRKVNVKEDEVGVDMYSNCREQGFFLHSYHTLAVSYNERPCVSFSENRNSDDIIVQYGLKKDFNDYGVLITDEKYTTQKKYFAHNEAEKAAEFITKFLTNS